MTDWLTAVLSSCRTLSLGDPRVAPGERGGGGSGAPRAWQGAGDRDEAPGERGGGTAEKARGGPRERGHGGGSFAGLQGKIEGIGGACFLSVVGQFME